MRMFAPGAAHTWEICSTCGVGVGGGLRRASRLSPRWLGEAALTAMLAVGALGCGRAAPSVADAGALAVPVAEIIGPVSACGAGFAHPNVCCRQGACLEHPRAPFTRCDVTELVFPDRRQCCPLGGVGACVDASNGDAGVDAAVSGPCSLPCGPEGTPSDDATFPVCENMLAQGFECFYCCSGGSCSSNVCRGPMALDGGVVACNTPACDPCPASWAASAPQVDLCCADATRCFSQSIEVEAPEGSGMSAGPGACDSVAFAGGHLFEAKCDFAASTCTCTIDGATTATLELAQHSCDLASCGVRL
jgi:hypothetical protein